MKINILVRQKRQEKDYTIDKLAEITGLSKGHLSKIEREKTDPTMLTLAKIAVALEVEIEDLYSIDMIN